MHFALGALLNFVLELIDFGALAADDDSRTRRKQPITSLLAARSISMALMPAERRRSFNWRRSTTSSCSRSA